MPTAVIVGCGVIGLSVAYDLATIPDLKVVIVAKTIPFDFDAQKLPREGELVDYTSLWAGAHYRPFPYTSSKGEIEQEYTKVTYEKLQEIRGTASEEECGIRFMPGFDYLENPSRQYSLCENGYNGAFLQEFATLEQSQLPSGIKFGARYQSWSLDPPVYLHFLYKKILSNFQNRVKVIKKELKSLDEVFDVVDTKFEFLINCSGSGLQLIDKSGAAIHDPDIYPIRGQTLLLQSDELQHTDYYDKTITFQTVNAQDPSQTDWTFLIPRPPLTNGTFILGGTKQQNKSEPKVAEPEQNDKLIQRASKCFPQLFKENGEPKFNIVRTNVGFRPASKNGFKFNKKTIVVDGRESILINCYGAGGSGYEMSFGAALEVYSVVKILTEVYVSKHKI